MEMNYELERMIRDSQELEILKRFLLAKLKSYGGITHEELFLACEMFRIREDGDSQ